MVVANVQSVGASLAVWAASGLLAWTGASSFAELGSSIPVNGGAQAYKRTAFRKFLRNMTGHYPRVRKKKEIRSVGFLSLFLSRRSRHAKLKARLSVDRVTDLAE